MIGSLEEGEADQVLARLFSVYEEKLEKDPENEEALRFFEQLGSVVSFCKQCNLNRR